MSKEQRSTQVIFVDVDDTLIRTVGTKRIPIPHVVREVKRLFELGNKLSCWSAGGAEYAREVAEELQIEKCFTAFLEKPQVMIDDQEPSEWRYLEVIHPNQI